MTKKQKLELTWIGKENRPGLEPCILLEDPEKSYHTAHRIPAATEGCAIPLDAATPRLIRIHAVANEFVQRA